MKQDWEEELNLLLNGKSRAEENMNNKSRLEEATTQMSGILADFYLSLKKNGIPEELASAMTMMFMARLISDSTGQDDHGKEK